MANRRTEGEAPPKSFPQTPPSYPQPTHDFTLQAVMEMQRTLGDMGAKVDRLVIDVKGQGEKLDAIRMRIAWAAGGAAVLGFLIATGLALFRILPFVPPP